MTDWADEAECLEAVRQDPFNLSHVINQTEKICIAAVKQGSWIALRYVKNQTPEIIKAALRQDVDSIEFVDRTKFKIEFTITELTNEEPK